MFLTAPSSHAALPGKATTRFSLPRNRPQGPLSPHTQRPPPLRPGRRDRGRKGARCQAQRLRAGQGWGEATVTVTCPGRNIPFSVPFGRRRASERALVIAVVRGASRGSRPGGRSAERLIVARAPSAPPGLRGFRLDALSAKKKKKIVFFFFLLAHVSVILTSAINRNSHSRRKRATLRSKVLSSV